MSSVAFDQSIIVKQYLHQTPGSAEFFRRATQTFPSGVTHDARHLSPYEVYVERASGSRKWDVDGNEYVDYSGGHGALLLGHNDPDVVAAVGRQLSLGSHYGANHELEIKWGECVRRLIPSADRVRFTSSGTEATLLCMRLARAFTGRTKIMRFTGHFHGWQDHVAFGVSSHFDGTASAGVLPAVAENMVLAPAGDADATEQLLDEHNVAMVIIEPTGASWGQIPLRPEFLQELRDMTQKRGVLLVFDEVISGFRCSPGGAQAVIDVTPDLTTLAKILAGGLPGGALVGRSDVLDLLDFHRTQSTGRVKISHHGTFNGNPLSAAAGIAALEKVEKSGACERANSFAETLRTELNSVLEAEGVPWVVYGSYSGFHIFTNPNGLDISRKRIEACEFDYRTFRIGISRETVAKLRLAMLIHGVELFTWPGGPTSSVHTADDLRLTCDAFRGALRLLREDGQIA